ncbi:MAG: flagellar motor protein MotB [Oscillospiraceae bacterium]|nr:flagellar motor protein MotB [Oscillospiraceae bacterium]
MKMRKKGGGGGGANWMDTYGDMVTLLLCFFVLLYSMSNISEEKWRMLVLSFNPDAAQTMTESSGNEGPFADPNTQDGSGMGLSQVKIDEDLEELYELLVTYVAQENAEESISVSKGDGKVFITFNQAVFFNGDDWSLREESKPMLEMVAEMLSEVAESIDEVRIMGHTAQAHPSKPNNISVDRLLSAQRAANTLAYIQQFCTLDPARMISEGYGQWRPVASNETAEGRAQNRRVEMIISGRNLEKELAGDTQSYYTVDNAPVIQSTQEEVSDTNTSQNGESAT